MKLTNLFMLLVLFILGIGTLVILNRDSPQYADGEPIAIVKDWSSKNQQVSSQDEAVWMEEYLGRGKWLVSKAKLPPDYSETNLTYEEWMAKTKGWDANRLNEYASDLSPEEQEAFQEELRTYNPGQTATDFIEKWYIYERSGLIEKIKD